MWPRVRLYAERMTKVDRTDLLRQAQAAAAEVETLEGALAVALEKRNALFLEIAATGMSASQISQTVGGKLGTSGVRYGILKARESR